MKITITGGIQTDHRNIITAAPVQFVKWIGLPADRLIGREFDLGSDEAQALIASGSAVPVAPVLPVASVPPVEPDPGPASKRSRRKA